MRLVPALVLVACGGSPYVTLTVQSHLPPVAGRVSVALAVPPVPEVGGLPDGGFFWFAHDGDSTQTRGDAHLNWGLDEIHFAPDCTGSVDMAGEDLRLEVGFDADAGVCTADYLRPNATR